MYSESRLSSFHCPQKEDRSFQVTCLRGHKQRTKYLRRDETVTLMYLSGAHLVALHYTGTDLWCNFPKFVIFSEIRVKFSVFEIHEHLLPVEKENNNFKIFLMGAFRDI